MGKGGNKKKVVKKKSNVDSQPYKYRRSVGGVSSLPFGRPKVNVKKSAIVKKGAPIIAQSSVVDGFFAKLSDAKPAAPSVPKFGKKAAPAKKTTAKPVAAKKAPAKPAAAPAPKKSFNPFKK